MLRFLAVGKRAFISFHAPLRRLEVVPTGVILASARTLASVAGTVGLAVLASVALCFGLWQHRSSIRRERKREWCDYEDNENEPYQYVYVDEKKFKSSDHRE